MEEIRIHRPQEDLGGNPGSDSGNDSMMVTVSHWPYCERLPVANMSVGEIRRRYSERFDIDPRCQPTLDGNEAGSDTIVRAGQMLMFVRRAGEKGM